MGDSGEIQDVNVKTEYVRTASANGNRNDAVVQYVAGDAENDVSEVLSQGVVTFKNSLPTGVISEIINETSIKRNDSYSKFGVLETVSLDVAEQELQNSQSAGSVPADVLTFTELSDPLTRNDEKAETKESNISEVQKESSGKQELSENSLSRYFGTEQTTKVSGTAQFFDVLASNTEELHISKETKHDINVKTNINTPSKKEVIDTLNESKKNEKEDNPPLMKFFVESKSGSDKIGKDFFDKIATETGGNLLNEISSSTKLTPDIVMHNGMNILSSNIPSHVNNVSFAAPPATQGSEEMYEAWIPSDNTRRILVTLVTSVPGTFFPERDKLTKPIIIIEEEMDDPVKLLLLEINSTMASQRRVLTADDVAQNEEGLKKLIDAECYHAAINLTGRLLKALKPSPMDSFIKHSPYSLKLWFVRIALFVKLRKFSYAEVESEAFGDFDKPDLYYEFYPDVYLGKKGSMVPFSFRLLLAELPQFQGNHQTALNNLYNILHIIQKIIKNLEMGCAEDGSMVELSDSRRKASLELWHQREHKVYYSILNCFLSQKDYVMSISVAYILLEKDKMHVPQLYSAIGRIYLQLGDMKQAQSYFDLAAVEAEKFKDKNTEVEKLINKALLSITRNENEEAYKIYEKARLLQPNNPVLVNNMAVCLLYMGRLKDSLTLLEQTIQKNPQSCLHDGILFNICTLYELESSHCTLKKHAMLNLVSKYVGDNFMVSCLKIPPGSKI